MDTSKSDQTTSDIVSVKDELVMKSSNEEDSKPTLLARIPSEEEEVAPPIEYKVYRRRWLGCAGMFLLNVACGMNGMWFSAIAIDTSEQLHITLNEINWLSNTVNLTYLPISMIIPSFTRHYGIRYSCFLGAACLFLAGWLKYCGTIKTLDSKETFVLMFFGQLFAGIAQPWFQVLGPKYSEQWYPLSSRTTATMIMSIGNPIGCALGQLLPPLVGTPRESVLVLAIITTVICPIVVIVGNKPPTPPTFSGSKESPRAINTLRAVIGLKTTDDAAMTLRERIDFGVIFMGFSILTAAITAFGSLISQVLVPYGYTSDESGIIGAVLLLSGLLGALITAPLFDRVFTHHLGLTLKGLVPPISACWIGMIWAVKSNGLAGIYVLLIFIGFASFTLLPVSLELACEVTRNPATSSAALWAGANLFSFIFIVSAEPLRAGPNAHPPDHLRSYIILQAVFAAFLVPLVMFVKGVQIRREMDVKLRSIK